MAEAEAEALAELRGADMCDPLPDTERFAAEPDVEAELKSLKAAQAK
jgi:hypothetical protein